MQNNDRVKTDIEVYWDKLQETAGFKNPVEFLNLHPMHQHAIIQSVNILNSVIAEVHQTN